MCIEGYFGNGTFCRPTNSCIEDNGRCHSQVISYKLTVLGLFVHIYYFIFFSLYVCLITINFYFVLFFCCVFWCGFLCVFFGGEGVR